MAKYKVYGDYGYVSENLLHESDSLNDARRWVDRYTATGDFGGYNMIEVAWFSESGEYMVEYRVDAPAEEFLHDEF